MHWLALLESGPAGMELQYLDHSTANALLESGPAGIELLYKHWLDHSTANIG